MWVLITENGMGRGHGWMRFPSIAYTYHFLGELRGDKVDAVGILGMFDPRPINIFTRHHDRAA
jgi:hypothetical protein